MMREQHLVLDQHRSPHKEPTGAVGRAARVGLAVVGAVTVWLTVSQWAIYPFTVVGQNNALRVCGLGVVLGLTAVLGWNATHRMIPGFMCVAGGLLLLTVAVYMPHVLERSMISEWVSGVVTLVAAIVVLLDP